MGFSTERSVGKPEIGHDVIVTVNTVKSRAECSMKISGVYVDMVKLDPSKGM
ncbi:hypothetical protein YC2023_081882 [Brassica napus]